MSLKSKAFAIVLLLYLLSVCCRLPVLDRPLSKHHEFNPATVLIAVEAWQQRGGGSQFAFVPFINYNNPGDYMKDTSWAIDGRGNGFYLSYGPGMYVVPYLVFTTLHITATPLHLQMLNLFILLVATILLFQTLAFVLREIKGCYRLVATGCLIFLFSPGILWFLGNGYVNVTLSLPFLIGAVYQALLILYGKKANKTLHYCLFSLCLIAGLYIDWNAFFVALVIGVFDVWQSIRQRRFPLLATVAAGSVVVGILLVVWQYTLYLPLDTIIRYWKERFFTRSIEQTGNTTGQKWGLLAANILTGYLPVVVLSVALFFRKRKVLPVVVPAIAVTYLLFTGISCGLYNLTFFNWSYIHDFSMVPLAFGISFIPVYLLITRQPPGNTRWYAIAAAYILLSLGQFYYINRPGSTAQNGDPYNTYQTLGNRLKAEVKPDEMIFMHSQSPLVNYYAKRFTFLAHNRREAEQKMKDWNYPKGVWVQETDFVFEGIVRIVPAR